jgi:uncharacterized cupredoxin-like copper-binding protein
VPLSRYRVPLALAFAGLALLALAVKAFAGTRPVQDVAIEYSRFEPEHLRFEAGQAVTFVITNRDPIDHEFILGNRQVQDRHELGTEPHHDRIPTEVSVPAGETIRTTVSFDEPGSLIIGCHLPGHWAYGMRAAVTVR